MWILWMFYPSSPSSLCAKTSPRHTLWYQLICMAMETKEGTLNKQWFTSRECALVSWRAQSTNNDSLQERAQLLFEGCTQQTSTHFKRGRTWLPNLYYLKTHTQQENKRMKDRVHQSLGAQQFTRSHIAKCKCREEKEDLERLQTIY